jgi:putative Holliday junction resolvase
MSQRARQFGQELEEHTRLPVYFMDERLTSQAVETAFAAARAAGATRRKDAALKDAMAAKIILENWLQSLPANEPERA